MSELGAANWEAGFTFLFLFLSGWATLWLFLRRRFAKKRRRWLEMEAWGQSDRRHGVDFKSCPNFPSRDDREAWKMGWLWGDDGKEGL